MVCLRPQPTTSPRLEGLALGCPQEESLFRRPWEARVILTKKSKLKRKRKYLVTLMQADPILSVLELPGDRREGRLVSAGQDLGWGEEREHMLTDTPEPLTLNHPRSPSPPQEVGADDVR